MSKNTEKTTKKSTYQLTHVNSSLLFFCCKIQIEGKPALEYFLTREKITRVDQINLKTRFLPPGSLIVEDVFFIVLAKNR